MREQYRTYFSKRFQTYGPDVHTLWGSLESQQQRFDVLVRVGDLTNKHILDVGCGFGDLFGFLRARGVVVADYLGLDCAEEVLAVARQQYPDANFSHRDLLNLDAEEMFDYTLASGVFFLPSEGWEEYTLNMIACMFRHSRIAVALNFLSQFSINRDPHSHYSDPGLLLSTLMHKITSKAALDHTYRGNDFTVYLYH